MKMLRDKIKSFWSERSKVSDLQRSESQVNFENESIIADLRVNSEVALIEDKLHLAQSDVVVDLGAGNGRFAMLFAPKTSKVCAVEYIRGFAKIIENQAKKLCLNNIEVVNEPAEEFCRKSYADVVFVSGLLHYLDDEQYEKTIKNIEKTLKSGGTLFLREAISVLSNEFIVDKFSEELNTHYCSVYRTINQHIGAFGGGGFELLEYAQFFEEGSVLNKRTETRQFYIVFRRKSI
jgi:precorrin-6B methylase 2